MTKQPSYRFGGHTELWEQRKLGECTEISAGGDIEKSKLLNNGKYPVIANALTSDGIVGYYNDSYRIEAPAVTVTGRGDVGVAKARNVNFTPVVRLLSLKSEHDVIFLENAINTQKIVIESTGVPQLTAPQLGRYKIFFPSLPEQTAIGSFFQDIDQLISLQQHKLEVLKEQKKTYLKLLFPAKGQTKPSLRFAGFEDDWKEVKLGEAYSFSQGQQVPVEEQFEQINENRIRFIRIVDLTNKGEEMRYIEFKSSTGRVYEKDIFFVRYGAVGVVGIGYDGIIANNLFRLNPQMSVDNKFMYVQFNREKFKKTLQGFSASTTMPAISFTDIRTIDIYLPSLPEQTAIGSFFQELDKVIAKQEEKVNQLKESKQTLLRKMFI